jgi:hypothetical protein
MQLRPAPGAAPQSRQGRVQEHDDDDQVACALATRLRIECASLTAAPAGRGGVLQD